MTEEEQMRWALEASLQELPVVPLGLTVKDKNRNSLPERRDKHKLACAVEGMIQQYNTLDQFGPLFAESKKTYKTAAAICGYLCCANAILLEQFIAKSMLSGEPLTQESIHAFATNTLSDIKQVLPHTRQCMDFIHKKRCLYWKQQNHTLNKEPSDCSLQAWVANFEVSDFFKGISIKGQLPAPSVFVRYNQWPELDNATPDERERLQEEKRFGGKTVVSNTGEKCVKYQEEDSVYFIEIFEGGDVSTFHTPEEFQEIQQEANIFDRHQVPRVVLLDLNGHFVAALACCIDEISQMFVFNTTGADYISNNMAISWSFDSIFGSTKYSLSTVEEKRVKDEEWVKEKEVRKEISQNASPAPCHVILLGDSTLDNVVWVTDPQKSVTCYLQRYLATNVHLSSRVTNFAADGFTSHDLLHGGKATLSYRARINAGDPFPISAMASDCTFQPLCALREVAQQRTGQQSPTHLVLSVGGNDIRHILNALNTLPEVMQSLQKNYIAIVRHLRTEHPSANLVLMLQYRPSWTQEHQNFYGVYSHIDHIPLEGKTSAVEKLHFLMESLYVPILALAAEENIPVIDLPNSFDIHNDALYSHQIEPSATGGAVIAHMLGEVIQFHDFTGSSRVYTMDTADVTMMESAGDSVGSSFGQLCSTVNHYSTGCGSSLENDHKGKKWLITARA